MSSAAACAYHRLSDEEILALLHSFQEEIDLFVRYGMSYPQGVQYTAYGLDLIDAIIRVDKRRFYFSVFHGMDINDCKKAALFAYWIIKFRPITITSPEHINTLGYNRVVQKPQFLNNNRFKTTKNTDFAQNPCFLGDL
jgi:hypothetical protein